MKQSHSSSGGSKGVPFVILLVGILGLVGVFFLAQSAGTALANTPDINLARSTYPTIVGNRIDSCNLCHTSAIPQLNPYGADYNAQGRGVASSLTSIEGVDSDGDGLTNLQEMINLTFPGNPADPPPATATKTVAYPPPVTATSRPSSTAVAPTATQPGSTATKVASATLGATATRTATKIASPTKGATATKNPSASRTPEAARSKTPRAKPTSKAVPTQACWKDDDRHGEGNGAVLRRTACPPDDDDENDDARQGAMESLRQWFQSLFANKNGRGRGGNP